MKPQNDTANSHAGPPGPAGADSDQTTGLPGLATWRGVYVFVFISFVIWVGLLAALTVMFS
jgi:hypothetical protein